MAKVIGIDLGTTNSVVAVMEGGDPVVIPQGGAAGSHAGRAAHPRPVAAARQDDRRGCWQVMRIWMGGQLHAAVLNVPPAAREGGRVPQVEVTKEEWGPSIRRPT